MKEALRSVACATVAAAVLMLATGCGGRQSDWEVARKADTAQAYTEFLQRYPDGDFTSQAKSRIADIKEETDWKVALAADTAQGYQQFLALHPDGARADEARIRVENLNLARAPVDTPIVTTGDSAAASQLPTAKLRVVPESSAKPEPRTSAAASGKFRVQLGAFSSAARARSEWQQAVNAHKAQLSELSYTLTKTTAGKDVLYRLQSSGVSEEKARAICAALRAAKQACVVVVP